MSNCCLVCIIHSLAYQLCWLLSIPHNFHNATKLPLNNTYANFHYTITVRVKWPFHHFNVLDNHPSCEGHNMTTATRAPW